MVTIKDLAKLSGVSPTTVSNVLHGRTNKLSKETLEKVQSAIKETNYVSNMGGRMLANHGSKIIGVILTYARREVNTVTEMPFYSEIIGALENTIRENGYYMMLYTSASITESLKLAQAWDIEGLIILGETQEEAKVFYETSHVPTVFIDTYGDNIPNVGIDDCRAMKALVAHLIALGHQKIAFLTDSKILMGVDKARYQGYRQAFEEYDLEVPENDLIHLSFRDEARYETYKQLYQNHFFDFTALCFSSDYFAIDAMRYFFTKNVKVPEDISITGFDNNILAKFSTPRLTTVSQNVGEKGLVAAQELIKMIQNGSRTVFIKQLDTSLIIGESSCAI